MNPVPLLLALAVVTLLDHVSTAYFLKHTTLQEGNPLMRKIIDRFGLTGLFVAKAASLGVIVLLNHIQPIAWQVLAGLCVMYATVVCWNVLNILEEMAALKKAKE